MEDLQIWFRFAPELETKIDGKVTGLLEYRNGSYGQIVGFGKELAIMIAQIEDMARLLPACIVNCVLSQMDECENLAQEVRREAKLLTRKLVSAHMADESSRGLVRFPLRLERIADELDSILTCCRIKARDSVEFSEDAHMELNQMLAILLDMLENLRDVMTTPNREVLNYIMSQGKEVARRLSNARLLHWMRLENGHCGPEAGSLFLDMLDSLKSSNEYVQKMAATFISLFNGFQKSDNTVSGNVSSRPVDHSAQETGSGRLTR